MKNFCNINLQCNKQNREQNIRNKYKNMSMNNDYSIDNNQTKKHKKSVIIIKNQNK